VQHALHHRTIEVVGACVFAAELNLLGATSQPGAAIQLIIQSRMTWSSVTCMTKGLEASQDQLV